MSTWVLRALGSLLVSLVVAAPAIADGPCDPGRAVEHLPVPAVAGEFGNSLAVADSLIAVGDPKAPVQSTGQGNGSVTLYRRGSAGWSMEATLNAPPSYDTEFGRVCVAVGDWLFCRGDYHAYAYRRDTSVAPAQWDLVENFRPPNRSWHVCAADSHRIVMRETEASTVLQADSTSPTGWTTLGELPPDVGEVKAIAGDLVVSVWSIDEVRVHRRSGSEWIADGRIPYPAERRLTSGYRRVAVASDGTRIAIGYSNRHPMVATGWVDVYRKDSLDEGWRLETRIEPPLIQPASASGFGTVVAIAGERLAIGNPADDFRNSATGAVFCYRLSGGEWRPVASYHGDPDNTDGQLGYCVAIQGDDLIATGSGFWNTINPCVIPFCADPGAQKACTPGIVGLFNFVEMYLTGDPGADYTADGSLSPEDLFRFLGDWFAGCPH